MIATLIEVSIPAVALIIVQIIINSKQQRLTDLKFDMIIDGLKKDLSRLEAKQDKHNNILERVTILEQSDKTQWVRIDELKAKLEV